MIRIDKVYTRQGDTGTSALIGGQRVGKDTVRLECYGTVDELNATLGLVVAALDGSAAESRLRPMVERIQNELFNLGTQLATPDADRRTRSPTVQQRHVDAMEAEIDALNQELAPLTSFVLPGGGAVSAHLHLARTVCRRTERLVVGLSRSEDVDAVLLAYLNRLSDALFVFGRWAAFKDGVPEKLWVPEKT
jgi:cob(I)alamin adenosyltransferase